MKRAIKNNYVEAVLEHPEKKFPLSTELTNGFQAIQKKAKDAGIKYASIPGFNVSFFDCEDESEMFHRAQRSSFGIGVVMRCKDILPIKKLVVLQGDDGSIKLYTDQAYQDLPDRFAGMLSEKIYIRIFSAYTNKLNRMYTGRVTDDESKVRALATHSVAGDLE